MDNSLETIKKYYDYQIGEALNALHGYAQINEEFTAFVCVCGCGVKEEVENGKR